MKKSPLSFAILAILFSGCALEDGIDCFNGAQRCDPNDETNTILQKCVNHEWVTDTTCSYKCQNIEGKSSCIEKVCDANETQCGDDNKTLLTCQNNQWVEKETCQYSCYETKCDEFVCDEGKKKCSDNQTLQICRTNRWVEDKICDFKCSSDECVEKVCDEAQKMCSENAKDLLVCKDNTWITEKVCEDECENSECVNKYLPQMTFDPESILIPKSSTQSVSLSYTLKEAPIKNRVLSISLSAIDCFILEANTSTISTDSNGEGSFSIKSTDNGGSCHGEITIKDDVENAIYSIQVQVYTDENNNFMQDQYETAIKIKKECLKDSDCDSAEGAQDGFCDSFLGYQCSTRCTSASECVPQNEQFNFICRDDGRCAPDTFEIVTASDTKEAEIPTIVATDCDFDIDWGDQSQIEHYDDTVCGKENIKHQYANSGTYHIKIKGSYNNWRMARLNDTASEFAEIYTPTVFTDVITFGPVGLGTAGLANNQLTKLSAIDIPDASKLPKLRAMFMNDSQFNSPIENWDIRNVEDMTSLFYGASEFNQPLAKWDTSNVTAFKRTFQGCSVFNQPIETWDTSKATTLVNMFTECSAFNQSINGWNISNVTNLSYLFYKASTFNQPLDKWDTSNVTKMSYLFYYATAFNQNINTWNTSKVTTLEATFYGASVFNQPLDNWDTSNVTSMKQTFKKAEAFNQELNSWDTSKVTTLAAMFMEAKSFNKAINKWNTSNVTTLESTFYNAEAFNQNINTDPELNSWDTSKVTTLESTFNGAVSFNQPIDKWNTSNVTTLASTFHGAIRFDQPLNNWNTSNVTTLASTFHGAKVFNHSVNSWNTSKVTTLKNAFSGTERFNQPLDKWNTSNVTSLEAAFNGARIFNLSLNSWNTSKVTSMKNAFYDASNFDQDLSHWSLDGIQSGNNMENMLFKTEMYHYFKNETTKSHYTSAKLTDSNICKLYRSIFSQKWENYIRYATQTISSSDFNKACR